MTAPVLVPVEVGSPAWLEHRRGGITASEVAIVLGISPWSSPYELYHHKRTGLGGQDSDAMAWGRDLEAAILRRFARRHPEYLVDSGALYEHGERSWQMATPDGLAYAVDPDPDRGYSAVAVVQAKAAARWEAWGDDGTDEIPVYYRAQVLWEMDVMGVEVAYVPVLVPPFGYREYRVEYDPSDVAFIRERADEFLGRLDAGLEPDIDDTAATGRALRQQFGDDAEGDVEIPATLQRQWSLADRLERKAGDRKRLAENTIRRLLGHGRRALVDGKVVGTRSVFDQRHVDLGALRQDAPELVAKHTTKSTVNRLAMRREKDPTHAR